MARAQRRERDRKSRRNRRDSQEVNVIDIHSGKSVKDLKEFARVKARDLKPINEEQSRYINMIKNHTVTVCIGVAGSGKTFIPANLAAQAMTDKTGIKKTILVRPNEPLGRSLGMLPGDLKDKLKPWLAPIADGFEYAIGKTAFDNMVEFEKIEFVAVEHLRGRTFNDSFVIVDEAQNLSIEAIKCLTTRIGTNCKIILCGDIKQQDISAKSGLGFLLSISEQFDYVPFSVMELEECVRSEEASAFLDIYEELEDMEKNKQ